ncbi:glycoside hydrolase family 3 C-terminal domain-containing protein [Stenotrophomonas sp.]|uniref:beta-glucosidase n=1 Tax=Stenotrophomonas sp. TaxID=69392 RepID=UPI0028AB861C|nr:glycoside hydrolase family 3 C-terminal domain-containing protein [Stenotrophomonas sp.]
MAMALGTAMPAMAAAPGAAQATSADSRAQRLVERMTLDEKIQMVHSYFGMDSEKLKQPKGALGSAGYIAPIERLGIPAQQIVDAGMGVTNPGGIRKGDFATAMPSGPANAATWNPELAFANGATMGREAWQQGFNVLLGGGANLHRDPRNGRNFEYAGEDPLLAGIMAGNVIKGVQSEKVVSTLKHFALNDMETRRNFHDALLGEQALHESDLLAFRIAIQTGQPGSVMCSYQKTNGTYGCEHDYLLREVLKQEWAYPGYVMTDWGGGHSSAKAANAGLDQQSAGEVFDPEVYFDKPLRADLQAGRVPMARLDDMVTRILRSFIAVGALDHPPQRQPIDGPTGVASAQRIIEEGAVLLKNERSLLPLLKPQRVVVIGGHADKGVLSGGGSSRIDFTMFGGNAVPGLTPTSWPGPVVYLASAPLAGLKQALPQAQIEYVDGSDPAKAAALAAQADVAIVFATQWAAESVDLPDMDLPDGQDALISAVAKANARTVVVLETNSAVRMPWLKDVGAVLQAWYPGVGGGVGIARLLTGEVSPSGRLPITWPTGLDQLPRPHVPGLGFNPAVPSDDVFDYRIEGANVGYKWFAAKGLTPLFPFGYGLSYTTFAYDALKVAANGNQVSATFRVRNTGQREGAAVPQLYVRLPGGHGTPARLVGWSKVKLAPGQATTVTVKAEPLTLAGYDVANRQWVMPAGQYTVELADSATAVVQQATVTLKPSLVK